MVYNAVSKILDDIWFHHNVRVRQVVCEIETLLKRIYAKRLIFSFRVNKLLGLLWYWLDYNVFCSSSAWYAYNRASLFLTFSLYLCFAAQLDSLEQNWKLRRVGSAKSGSYIFSRAGRNYIKSLREVVKETFPQRWKQVHS